MCRTLTMSPWLTLSLSSGSCQHMTKPSLLLFSYYSGQNSLMLKCGGRGAKAIQLNENCSQWILFEVFIRKTKFLSNFLTLHTQSLFKSHSHTVRKPHCINLEFTSQTHQTDPGGKQISSKVEMCLKDLALKTFELRNVLLWGNLPQYSVAKCSLEVLPILGGCF